MPSVPGSLLDIIEDQAGTVIAGMQDSSSPYTPVRYSSRNVGNSSRYLSKTSSGAAQSSPITMTFRSRGFRPNSLFNTVEPFCHSRSVAFRQVGANVEPASHNPHGV